MTKTDELIIEKQDDIIKVYKNDKCIIIPENLEVYIYDLKLDYDLYFNAVESKFDGKYYVVDYRENQIHKIIGYDLHKIMLPSLSEAVGASLQYIKFADLNKNSVVLDLGSYCALTAILFDNAIRSCGEKAKGKVITVEADPKNLKSINYNLNEYKKVTGRDIEFLHAAVWDTNSSIKFSSEGYMGASAYHVGTNRGKEIEVPAYTLSHIAKLYNLKKVDFIKCDIEGAEVNIIKDYKFFKKYSPKIIIECHYLDLEQTKNTKEDVINCLEKYGYNCETVKQDGFDLPLLECTPKGFMQKFFEFLERIFSIKKVDSHIVFTFLGIKLKIKLRKK